MFYLRMAGTLLGFLAASVYGVTIAVVRRDRSRVAVDYAGMLVRLMRPALGLSTRVQGREWLAAARPCIYIANHQSMYDVPVLAERPATVNVRVLEPIDTTGLTDADVPSLIDRAEGAMQHALEALGRAREERTPGLSSPG